MISFKTTESTKEATETFLFTKKGEIYSTLGTKSGKNKYRLINGSLVHMEHSSVNCSISPTGDFIWSHGYSSRIIDPVNFL